MFVLGHIGIGRALSGPKARALPVAVFCLGAMLPDVIDKPLYYAHLSEFVSCTRTFGHTGLFAVAVAAVAFVTRSRSGIALAIGTATHPALDAFLDFFSPGPSSTWIAFSWPFLHQRFSSYLFETPLDQLMALARVQVIACELIGGWLLWREYRRRSSHGPDDTLTRRLH